VNAGDPGYATCGIGSLGHESPDAAVRTVLDSGIEIPFWPQLPRRGTREHMVAQAALNLGFLIPVDARGAMWRMTEAGGPGVAPAGVIAAEHMSGLVAFERAALQAPLGRIKGQWIGPVTLLHSVVLESGRALASEPVWAAAALAALHCMVVAQIRRLRCLAPRVDLWLDEPLLGLAERDPALVTAALAWYTALREACGPDVRLGVHTCAAPTPLLFELGVGVVSFDVTSPPPNALRPLVAGQLQRGSIAWGLVPSGREAAVDPAVLVAPALEWRERCGMSRDEFAAHSLVTPACGLASLDAVAGAERLGVVVECARRLRREAAGGSIAGAARIDRQRGDGVGEGDGGG
jgi:hypothetical protein